jgi:hypothetical protein
VHHARKNFSGVHTATKYIKKCFPMSIITGGDYNCFLYAIIFFVFTLASASHATTTASTEKAEGAEGEGAEGDEDGAREAEAEVLISQTCMSS